MEREAAIQKLSNLVNKDLRELADHYGVTVFKNGGGKNKGCEVPSFIQTTISQS